MYDVDGIVRVFYHIQVVGIESTRVEQLARCG